MMRMTSLPLPEEFIHLRRPMLDGEWDDFLAAYDESKSYGLRQNLLRKECRLPFTLTPVPWAKGGFYAVPEEHPGRHPLHEAGAYYIQEPSAMSVVSLLDPQPGDTVCDLCAAPGGKSTQLAGLLQGQGLLVANEVIPSRAKILSQNIERLGIINAMVTNHTPDQMASRFPLFFDRIVVDAPCSGEGMFRKDETAIREWSPENIAHCAERQRMILNCADEMLRPGGVLVYSTCTFAPEEDEEMIAWFLLTHPDYSLADWKNHLDGQDSGLSDGRPDYINRDRLSQLLCGEGTAPLDEIFCALHGTLRLWPHKLRGEGHFAARLEKHGDSIPARQACSSQMLSYSGTRPAPKKARRQDKKSGKTKSLSVRDALPLYQEFAEKYLNLQDSSARQKEIPPQYTLLCSRLLLADGSLPQLFGDELYLLPLDSPSPEGLKILRAGLDLGVIRKNRFEPSHALSKALSPELAAQHKACTEEEADRFLQGETLPCDSAHKGWILVCFENQPLGWGKAQNGMIKNHYPKGLRRHFSL